MTLLTVGNDGLLSLLVFICTARNGQKLHKRSQENHAGLVMSLSKKESEKMSLCGNQKLIVAVANCRPFSVSFYRLSVF